MTDEARVVTVWVVMVHDYQDAWVDSAHRSEESASAQMDRLKREDTAKPPYGYSVSSVALHGEETVG
jgi:hypothetical protein